MRNTRRYATPLVWQVRKKDYDDDDFSGHEYREWLRCRGDVDTVSVSQQTVAGAVNDTVTTHTISIPYQTKYRDNWSELSEMRIWDYTGGVTYAVVGVTRNRRDREIVVSVKQVAAFNADAVEPPTASIAD